MFFSQFIANNNNYLNFGLQLYLKKIRVIKKWIRIKKIRFFNVIETYIQMNYGLTFQSIFDAFFIGSIFLLFFKFLIRLCFFTNPFWYFNIMIFVFGIFLQVYFNPNPLFLIREAYVKILKKGIGKNYWYDYTPDEFWNHVEKHGFGVEMPQINIFDTSFFNKICQKIFIFFILFRLSIINSPFLFLFFNFLFTYFLLFNQFLLLSSFISFLILISRLSFFATDYSLKDFYTIINIIEEKESDEYIIPNWENAELLSLIITRSFSARDSESNKRLIVSSLGIKSLIYPRYIQINKKFEKYSENDDIYILFDFRKSSELDYKETNGMSGKPYFNIIKKRKKRWFLFCWPVSWKDGFFSDLKNFVLHSVKRVDKIMPERSEQANNHPSFGGIIKDHLIITNETTIRENKSDPVFLAPIALKNNNEYTGRAIVSTCSVKKIPKEFLKTIEFQHEIKLPPGFVPAFTDVNLDPLIRKNFIIMKFLNTIHKRNDLALPSHFNCCLTFADPFSNKNQSIRAIDTSLLFLEGSITNKYLCKDPHKRNHYIDLYKDLRGVKKELKNMPEECFGTNFSNMVEYKIFILDEMTKAIQFDIPPVVAMKQVLHKHADFFDLTDFDLKDISLLHIKNLHLVPSEKGGENNKKITYKNFLERKELKCRETNCTNNSSDIVA